MPLNKIRDFNEKQGIRLLKDTSATVRAIVGFVVFVGAAIALLYAAIAKNYSATVSVAAILVGGFANAVLAIILWLYLAKIHDPPFYVISELKGTVTITPAGNHHKYDYRREQIVRATRGGLRLIEIRSHWTGRCSDDKNEISSLFKGHSLLDGKKPEEDGRIHRWIYPGRALDRDQRETVGVHQVMEDDREPMLPYYREGGGRYVVESLTVIARFPVGEEPERVWGVIWNTNRKPEQGNEVGQLDYARLPDNASGFVDYKVVVHKPKRYHSYGVRWDW